MGGKIDRVGETNYNKHGRKMTIVSYNKADDIEVLFDSGYQTNTTYQYFKKGAVRDVLERSVYKIGYLGIGDYSVMENKKKTLAYVYWNHMLERCYGEQYKKTDRFYLDVYVCEEWHNFQNFAKWFYKNYYETNDGYTMDLDKDILYKGNKIYSPQTCIFVSHRINCLFLKNQRVRGSLPIGITYVEKTNTYCARVQKGKERITICSAYKTPTDAFYLGYKPQKELYIKQLADEYKDRIPKVLYLAMYNYKVEITD